MDEFSLESAFLSYLLMKRLNFADFPGATLKTCPFESKAAFEG